MVNEYGEEALKYTSPEAHGDVPNGPGARPVAACDPSDGCKINTNCAFLCFLSFPRF